MGPQRSLGATQAPKQCVCMHTCVFIHVCREQGPVAPAWGPQPLFFHQRALCAPVCRESAGPAGLGTACRLQGAHPTGDATLSYLAPPKRWDSDHLPAPPVPQQPQGLGSCCPSVVGPLSPWLTSLTPHSLLPGGASLVHCSELCIYSQLCLSHTGPSGKPPAVPGGAGRWAQTGSVSGKHLKKHSLPSTSSLRTSNLGAQRPGESLLRILKIFKNFLN